MSRYRLEPLPDRPDVASIAIGWDRPLASFFVTVFGPRDADGEDVIVEWQGTAHDELPTAAAAIAVAARYATIPDGLSATLETDRLKTLATPDGAEQVRTRRFLRPRY